MTQTTFALLTNKGRSKEAVALANGSDIVVTHIAIGDGNTVPSGGETKLYHEVDRKAITGHGLVTGTTNTAYFDIHLMAADGPYTIREAGLYDADGDLIAIAYYDPPIQKPTPDSGQTVEGDIRLEIAFSNVENIIVQVDTSMQVPLQRLTVCPWIPVKSAAFTNPPTEPKVGDAYVIPSNATGVWKGQSQKIAEFTSAGWAITTTPDGHGIGLPDGSVYIKIGGKYVLPQNKTIGFSAAGSVSLNIPPSVNFLMQKYKIVEFDTEKSFNNATGSYVCTFDGYFTISGWFWFADVPAITKVYLQKNNDLIAEQSTNAHGRVLSVTTTVKVQNGDQLRMLLVQESGTTMTTYDQYRATCGFSGIFAGSVK